MTALRQQREVSY
ncbi:unnamed protein product, partial [Rotaria sordida]